LTSAATFQYKSPRFSFLPEHRTDRATVRVVRRAIPSLLVVSHPRCFKTVDVRRALRVVIGLLAVVRHVESRTCRRRRRASEVETFARRQVA
jgi:hypothetical protein